MRLILSHEVTYNISKIPEKPPCVCVACVSVFYVPVLYHHHTPALTFGCVLQSTPKHPPCPCLKRKTNINGVNMHVPKEGFAFHMIKN